MTRDGNRRQQKEAGRVFLISEQARGRCGSLGCCGGQGRGNPLPIATMGDVFTKGLRFAQGFSAPLWDAWETGAGLGQTQTGFPKLLNSTARIWKTRPRVKRCRLNRIGWFSTFTTPTTGITVFFF